MESVEGLLSLVPEGNHCSHPALVYVPCDHSLLGMVAELLEDINAFSFHVECVSTPVHTAT